MEENYRSDYAEAYSEVLEILKYVKEDDYEKIPEEMINIFKRYSNNEHVFDYNPNIDLNRQGALLESRAIISIIYREYWANDAQRNEILEREQLERQAEAEKQNIQYNPYDIFGNNTMKKEPEVLKDSMILQEKESFFTRFVEKFKSIFKKTIK